MTGPTNLGRLPPLIASYQAQNPPGPRIRDAGGVGTAERRLAEVAEARPRGWPPARRQRVRQPPQDVVGAWSQYASKIRRKMPTRLSTARSKRVGPSKTFNAGWASTCRGPAAQTGQRRGGHAFPAGQ